MALKLLESDKVVDAMCSELMVVQPTLTQENIGHIMWFMKSMGLLQTSQLCHVMTGNARMLKFLSVLS